MCIITSDEIEAGRQRWLKVTKTNIFCRHTRPGYQAIAYNLSIASRSAAAMILPLPVVPRSGPDALRFIDLSGYPEFFDDLSVACEPELVESDFEDLGASDTGATLAPLTVHEVGDFVASYVPTMADFSRLDPRFRLPDEIWKKMPDYSDYGFAVFQLKIVLGDASNETDNAVHPMAFEFPTREPARLYFPTVHVHDGEFHSEAGFYHRFFCQRENARAEFKYQHDWLSGCLPTPEEESIAGPDFLGYRWYSRSIKPVRQLVAVDRSEGLIDPDSGIHSMELHGNFPNVDIWLEDGAGGLA